MILLPGMWLRSYFYDFQPPAHTSLLLLAAAALAGVLGLMPGIRNTDLWMSLFALRSHGDCSHGIGCTSGPQRAE